MGYTKETLKGMSWLWALRVFTRGLSFVRIAVIARLLTPSLFGLYGISALVLSLVEVFTESGINILIIQEKEDVEKIVSTAWVVSIVRGVLISLIIMVSSPFVVYFFNTPDVYYLIFLISVVPLIRGFINPAIITFQKELQFKKEFFFRGFIFAVESLLAVVFVGIFRDPSGIIYGLIIGALLEVVISFLFVKPTPTFSYDKMKIRKIISRGKWLTASGIFNYLYHNADDAVVGRVLGTASLGLYDMAYRISMLPITEVGETISKVILPVYSKISDDNKRLKRAFTKTMLSTAIMIVPVGVFFFVFAEQIVLLVLGEQWIEAVPIFKVLAVFAVIRALLTPVYTLFLSVKKQEYNTIITFISFVTMIVSIIPFISLYGLVGAGISVVLGSLVAVPLALYYLRGVFVERT